MCYDPLIARFVSADPHIQDLINTQSLNRYAYVNNNPLAYTDPSGYFSIGKLFKSIVKAVTNLLDNDRARGHSGRWWLPRTRWSPCCRRDLGSGAGFSVHLSVAYQGRYSSGGKKIFMSGRIAGRDRRSVPRRGNLTDGHFGGTGGTNGAGQTPADYFGTSNYIANVAGHAAVGCASSAAGGGSCQAGALSAGLGARTSPVTMKAGFIGGRSNCCDWRHGFCCWRRQFVNGAVTAAFGYLFNSARRVLRGPGHHMVTNQIARTMTGQTLRCRYSTRQ